MASSSNLFDNRAELRSAIGQKGGIQPRDWTVRIVQVILLKIVQDHGSGTPPSL